MSSLAKSPRDKTKVNVAWVGGGIPEAGEAGEAGEFFTSTLLTFFQDIWRVDLASDPCSQLSKSVSHGLTASVSALTVL